MLQQCKKIIVNSQMVKNEIEEYYDDRYKGHRGKCVKCKIDFPLE